MNRSRRGTALAGLAALALVTGLAVLPAQADSSPKLQRPATTGALGQGAAPGGPVTRDQVIARARHWVEQRVGYSQTQWWSDSATGGPYRQDCSGFVSMAWQLADSRDTSGLLSVADRITWEQLQPGDALDTPDGGGHVILFAGWTDKAKGVFRYYSESGGSRPASLATVNRGADQIARHPTATYVPLRYRKITDAPAPPPPAPPAPSVRPTPVPAPVPSLSSARPPAPAPPASSAPPARPSATAAPGSPSPSPTGPVPAPAAPARRPLRNVATGLCADVPTGGVPNMGHPVVQERCGAGAGHLQQFDLVPGTGGASGFALRPAGSGLCVDPPDHEAPANAQVGLYPCDYSSADNHLWLQRWNGEHTAFLLVNAKSDGTPAPMCLDVPGHADPTEGLRLGVYPCHPESGDDHWWTLA
ncbi:ricin-type beta-trefoil lectin domain protein [Kitasatospora sp. NPDC093550]|uniref:ricin-type beta-trefoil lectin domain protein n=1 Tax=Kitasatospora sp. NPDC093550 TaxID=3364089 RepID=UPI00380AF542